MLILDDVLATGAAGGTLGAAVRLFERCGVQVAGVGVVLELAELRAARPWADTMSAPCCAFH